MAPNERMDGLLRGWKEIEAELKMTRRAILACGYPIRRERLVKGGYGGVFAFKDELASFQAARPKVTEKD